MDDQKNKGLVLVARKPGFGLPAACPSCLPVYLYLLFAMVSFDMHFDIFRLNSGLFLLHLSLIFYLSIFISGFSSGLDILLKKEKEMGFESWLESRTSISWPKFQRVAHIARFLIFTPSQMILLVDGIMYAK